MHFDADNPLLIHYDPNNPRIVQHILTDEAVKRDWPYQVIVEAYLCTGHRFHEQRTFCETLGLDLCKRVGSIMIGDRAYRIFAFSDRRHAQVFAGRFNGIRYVVGRA